MNKNIYTVVVALSLILSACGDNSSSGGGGSGGGSGLPGADGAGGKAGALSGKWTLQGVECRDGTDNKIDGRDMTQLAAMVCEISGSTVTYTYTLSPTCTETDKYEILEVGTDSVKAKGPKVTYTADCNAQNTDSTAESTVKYKITGNKLEIISDIGQGSMCAQAGGATKEVAMFVKK